MGQKPKKELILEPVRGGKIPSLLAPPAATDESMKGQKKGIRIVVLDYLDNIKYKIKANVDNDLMTHELGLLAIFILLLTLPNNSEVICYLDSSVVIDKWSSLFSDEILWESRKIQYGEKIVYVYGRWLSHLY